MDDQLTHQIINALQVHPRVPWARLGQVLNVDSSTISRRWTRLVADGLVWTSCFEGSGPRGADSSDVVALVEVRCRPGTRSEVVEQLGRRRRIFSVNCTSGERDLYTMVTTQTLADMDTYVDEQVCSIPGVTDTRTHFLRYIWFESSYWRLPFLTPSQVNALEKLRPETISVSPRPEHREVIAALSDDVRRSAAEVQAVVGRSTASVARHIETVLASDWVRWRIDFAQSVMGWSAGAVIWMDVPQPQLGRTAAALRAMPTTRMCASVAGRCNLVVTLWLRTLSDLDEFERVIATSMPQVRIRDRWIVPRTLKRGGFLLDSDGRRTEHVSPHGEPVYED